MSEPELIVCAPRGGYPEYFGSRAQLEAEGLIPEGTVWPEGRTWGAWTSGFFHFSLFRTRQQGTKGPAKVWMEGDWWCLRCELVNARDGLTQKIREMQAELAELMHRRSPEGARQSNETWKRLSIAREDEAFQAFKATFEPKRKKLGCPAKEARP